MIIGKQMTKFMYSICIKVAGSYVHLSLPFVENIHIPKIGISLQNFGWWGHQPIEKSISVNTVWVLPLHEEIKPVATKISNRKVVFM